MDIQMRFSGRRSKVRGVSWAAVEHHLNTGWEFCSPADEARYEKLNAEHGKAPKKARAKPRGAAPPAAGE